MPYFEVLNANLFIRCLPNLYFLCGCFSGFFTCNQIHWDAKPCQDFENIFIILLNICSHMHKDKTFSLFKVGIFNCKHFHTEMHLYTNNFCLHSWHILLSRGCSYIVFYKYVHSVGQKGQKLQILLILCVDVILINKKYPPGISKQESITRFKENEIDN